MIFSGDHACDICCSLDPRGLTDVSSGPHDYGSVSFFYFVFHWFSWLLAVVQGRAAILNVTAVSYLQGAHRKSTLEERALFPLESFIMRKMIIKMT